MNVFDVDALIKSSATIVERRCEESDRERHYCLNADRKDACLRATKASYGGAGRRQRFARGLARRSSSANCSSPDIDVPFLCQSRMATDARTETKCPPRSTAICLQIDLGQLMFVVDVPARIVPVPSEVDTQNELVIVDGGARVVDDATPLNHANATSSSGELSPYGTPNTTIPAKTNGQYFTEMQRTAVLQSSLVLFTKAF